MGVDLLTGGLGSGKSYDAVRQIIDLLSNGRRVHTNIDGLNGEKQRKMIGHITGLAHYELESSLIYWDDAKDRDKIRKFWEHIKPNDVCVWDECHKYWNSRQWKDDVNLEAGNWFAESRHSGNDVLLITQNQKKLDANIRDIVSWRYHYTNLKQFGVLGKGAYTSTAFYENSDAGFTSRPRRYRKEIFHCYKSVVEDNVLLKNGILKGSSVFKHPVFFILPVIFIAFLYFLFKSSLFTDGVFGNKALTASVATAAPITKEIENNIPEPDSKPESKPLLKNKVESMAVGDVVLGTIDGKRIIKTSQGIKIQ